MPCDPILMKNLLKKVLVEPMNSAQDPLSWMQTQLKPSFSSIQTHAQRTLGSSLKSQFILLFSLLLLLFISLTALFGIIFEFHYTISTNFYFYLQYLRQNNFSLNKISKKIIESQIVLYIYSTFSKKNSVLIK